MAGRRGSRSLATTMAAITNGKMTPISAVKPMSLVLCRLTVIAEAISRAEQRAKKSPIILPVPMPSNTMMRTPDDHHRHGDQRHRPRPLLQEYPRQQRGEHGGEGEDEHQIGRRRVVDGGDEGDRAEAVEHRDDGAELARNEARRVRAERPPDRPDDQRREEGRAGPQHQDRPRIALGQADQRDVDGERQPADRRDQQSLAMIGVGGMQWLAR